MDNNNKGKKLLERDGFYLVLFLCVCLVALTAVWVTKNSIDNLATENGFVNYQNGELMDEGQVANNEDEIHLIKEDENAVATASNSKENLNKAKEKLEKEEGQKKEANAATKKENIAGKAVMPVDGEISRDYSETELSYSNTLEQWELHKGIDIKAKEGTPVKAAMDGEVSQITKNGENGITITLKHPGNVVTVYGNLSMDTMVEVGQKVNCGDIISGVGKTSIVESADGSHLHFEALKDEKNIDPLSIIK